MESSESVTPSVEEARAFLGRVVGGYNAHKTEYIEVIGLLLAALVEARAERDAPAHAHYNAPSQPLTATEEVLVIVVGQYQEAEAEIARLRDALDVLDLRAGSAEERQALNFERAKRAESARDKYRAEVERLRAEHEALRAWKVLALRDVITPVAAVTCDCDAAYTARGRHEPNSFHGDYGDVIESARALSTVSSDRPPFDRLGATCGCGHPVTKVVGRDDKQRHDCMFCASTHDFIEAISDPAKEENDG